MRAALGVLASVLIAGCTAATSSLGDAPGGPILIRSVTAPTTLGGVEQPATVTAELTFPADASGRVPAVILAHSCAGVSANVTAWAQDINRMGFAALVVDSFTGRGVEEVCTGRARVGIGSRLTDVFRALELLATHARVDPQRIALVGFSHGGWAALWASHSQFQRRFQRGTGPDFAAYAAFYPAACNARLINEADVSAPLRIFLGTADDWTPIGPCREWVARRRTAGQQVSLVEYDGAAHAFDVPFFSPSRRFEEVVNPASCVLVQQPDGTFVDADGRPLTGTSPCMTRGATMAYDAAAHRQAIADLKAFLDSGFAGRR